MTESTIACNCYKHPTHNGFLPFLHTVSSSTCPQPSFLVVSFTIFLPFPRCFVPAKHMFWWWTVYPGFSHFSHRIGPESPELALSFPNPVCPNWCVLLPLYENISILPVPAKNSQILFLWNYSILIHVTPIGCPLSIMGFFFFFFWLPL